MKKSQLKKIIKEVIEEAGMYAPPFGNEGKKIEGKVGNVRYEITSERVADYVKILLPKLISLEDGWDLSEKIKNDLEKLGIKVIQWGPVGGNKIDYIYVRASRGDKDLKTAVEKIIKQV